jgi:UrcA family protein
MKFNTLMIAAFALTTIAQPAQAQERISESRVVSYKDLDLSTAAGTKTLARRILKAAEAMCGGAGSQFGLTQLTHFNQCVAKARDEASIAIAAKTNSNAKVASASR